MGLGITLSLWIKLLVKYRFAVEPSKIPTALITTCASFLNSIFGYLEELTYGRRIDETDLVAPPIFIIGFWRSGTTHLHNLLSLDERFTYPTTYTCLFPNHFLLTERVVKKLLRGFLPETRPMDNMRLSWDMPQEDEVALALLTGLSPYIDFAFPNVPRVHHRFLDFEGATAEKVKTFKRAIKRLVRKQTYRSRKRVVLKSPAHSYRIKLLAETFPGAKFIHIHRDPIAVFFSAVHTFKIQRDLMGLTAPDNTRLEREVVQDMLLCHRRIQEGREPLPPEQFHEIRFEILERKPIAELEKTYDKLKLGGFKMVRPKIEAYLASIADYKKNVYDIPDEKRDELIEIFYPILQASRTCFDGFK